MWKKVLPARINEVVGVQHIKAYLFDDDLIISGANLSGDYFTNRQDRYILFKNNPLLADHFEGLIDTISRFSFHLSDQSLSSPFLSLPNNCPDPSSHSSSFSLHSSNLLSSFLSSSSSPPSSSPSYPSNHSHAKEEVEEEGEGGKDTVMGEEGKDTVVVVGMQGAKVGIREDERYLRSVLRSFDSNGRSFMSTAYFNIAKHQIEEEILDHCPCSHWSFLTSAPSANGFYGSSGLSSLIPSAYLQNELHFLRDINNKGKKEMMMMNEYMREGWTYHAKGMWYYPPSSPLPSFSIIGSSNFGLRSFELDLEAQLYLFTSSPSLSSLLHSVLFLLLLFYYN